MQSSLSKSVLIFWHVLNTAPDTFRLFGHLVNLYFLFNKKVLAQSYDLDFIIHSLSFYAFHVNMGKLCLGQQSQKKRSFLYFEADSFVI